MNTNTTTVDDELPEEVKQQLEALHKFRRSAYAKMAPVFDSFPPEQIESKISFARKEVVDENGETKTELMPQLDKLTVMFSHGEDSDGSDVQNETT